jgi:predicted GH43/DUF377 family glycosyl hydrolase
MIGRPIGTAAAVCAAAVAVLPVLAGADRVRTAADAQAAASRWTLSPANPIVSISRPPRGLAGGGKGPQIWNDPSVLREGNDYWMYASMGHGGPRGVAIYRLRSADGVSWTVDNGGSPVLEPGDRKKKDFDWFGVETPSVIRAGREYHMYYSAYPDGKIPLVTMGHAVSTDGLHWQKRGELRTITAPVGQHKGNPWGRLARGEPAALYRDGTFFLYYTDVKCRTEDCKGDVPVVRGIGLATSRDGHTFEVRGSAPILLQGGPYRVEDRWEGYSTPAVALRDGQVELFVDVFRKGGKESIQSSLAHFRSADGVRFDLIEADIVTPGPEWCAVSVRSPAVLAEGNSWKLWFAGDNWDPDQGKPRGRQVDAGIGLVTAPIR